MSKIPFIALFLFFSIAVYAQSDYSQFGSFEINVNGEWLPSEDANQPLTPPKSESIDGSIISNIRYPTLARRMGVEGNTLMQFEIDDQGNVSGHNIIYHIGADTDKELQNLISKIPTKWTPAKTGNDFVPSRVQILFKFTLYGEQDIENKAQFYAVYVITPISADENYVKNARDLVSPVEQVAGKEEVTKPKRSKKRERKDKREKRKLRKARSSS